MAGKVEWFTRAAAATNDLGIWLPAVTGRHCRTFAAPARAAAMALQVSTNGLRISSVLRVRKTKEPDARQESGVDGRGRSIYSRQAEARCHIYEFSQRLGLHLAHYASAMGFDRRFTDA